VKIKTNLSGIVSAASKGGGGGGGGFKPQIGKVFGVITTLNTPTKELFEVNNGWNGVGTVFYLPYDQTKYYENIRLEECQVAIPLDSNFRKYPLVGELIYLIDGPSPATQIVGQASQKYYIGTLNIWNNIQQNSPFGNFLGKSFVENVDIRNLTLFEGDVMVQGRKGNGIRFGTTVKSFSTDNEWSNVGTDGDPITIMVNGYVTTNPSDLTPNIEEINKEKSSIYMSSTQRLPLIPGALIKNPFNTSIEPRNYFSPQIILNSDRITLNSKKDEVLIFSKSNIELSTDNIINLNAGEIIHLNIDNKNPDAKILLGTDKNGTLPSEPVLLGGKTHDLLLEILNALTTLAGFLSAATVPSPEGAVPVPNCNLGGEQLFNDVSGLIDKLSTITSEKVYTV
jgi:hypothetical protein